MTEETVAAQPVREPTTVKIEEASIMQLKVAAFDIDIQIKQLQHQYQTVLVELDKRSKLG